MHPINISRTTVQHMCNWKGIQILTIWLISKGLLFFYTPCIAKVTYFPKCAFSYHDISNANYMHSVRLCRLANKCLNDKIFISLRQIPALSVITQLYNDINTIWIARKNYLVLSSSITSTISQRTVAFSFVSKSLLPL
jgi:hypothetical protein